MECRSKGPDPITPSFHYSIIPRLPRVVPALERMVGTISPVSDRGVFTPGTRWVGLHVLIVEVGPAGRRTPACTPHPAIAAGSLPIG